MEEEFALNIPSHRAVVVYWGFLALMALVFLVSSLFDKLKKKK
jgi:hypothetical protein